jgi:hypothetical protein
MRQNKRDKHYKTKEKARSKILQQDRDWTRTLALFLFMQAQELSSIATKIDLAIRQLSH